MLCSTVGRATGAPCESPPLHPLLYPLTYTEILPSQRLLRTCPPTPRRTPGRARAGHWERQAAEEERGRVQVAVAVHVMCSRRGRGRLGTLDGVGEERERKGAERVG